MTTITEELPPKWTPVTEALPQEDKKVFVFFNGRITVAALTRRDEPWCEAGYFRVWAAHPVTPNDSFEAYEWKKVTHWMPIPEMP